MCPIGQAGPLRAHVPHPELDRHGGCRLGAPGANPGVADLGELRAHEKVIERILHVQLPARVGLRDSGRDRPSTECLRGDCARRDGHAQFLCSPEPEHLRKEPLVHEVERVGRRVLGEQLPCEDRVEFDTVTALEPELRRGRARVLNRLDAPNETPIPCHPQRLAIVANLSLAAASTSRTARYRPRGTLRSQPT